MIYDKLKPHIKAKMKENAEEYDLTQKELIWGDWLINK